MSRIVSGNINLKKGKDERRTSRSMFLGNPNIRNGSFASILKFMG